MTIADTNSSRILILLAITLFFTAIFFVTEIVFTQKRKENLEEAEELIKERHQKIENYRIKKRREEALKENDVTWR